MDEQAIYNLYSVQCALNTIDMAKRFTDTEKYKKHFVRSLKAPYKLLWDYILCDCNHAGIWIVDFEAARMYLGKDVKICERAALEAFNKDEKRVIPIDYGEKWFIVGFIEYQYGELNPRNRVHASVIKMLERYGLWKDGKLNVDVSNVPVRKLPQQKQLADTQEQQEQQETEDELLAAVTDVKPKGYEQMNLDFISEDFRDIFYTWLDYKRERRERYKTQSSLETAYKRMLNLGNSDRLQVRLVVEQSIGNNWAGLFALREARKQTDTTTHTTDKISEDYPKWQKR
jgi:hypothetical protein